MDKHSEQYIKDLKDWQEKQYLPGAYTGSDMPFPIKHLPKTLTLKTLAILFLLIFFAGVVYGFVEMIKYIIKY